jgi:manganese transport protein
LTWLARSEQDGGQRTSGGPRHFALLGAAILVSVGYVDPGNWATDLEGGSRFGYRLLWVLVASGLIATLLQTLSLRLGVLTGLDLASACRVYYPRNLLIPLWVLAELAIVACDLAEVLGSAVALKLLFGLPLLPGALLTVCDVFLLLAVQRRGARNIELLVAALVFIIALCLGLQVMLSRPDWRAMTRGLVPMLDAESAFVAVGMLGATVMPHNLYLHSAIVPTRSAAEPAAQAGLLRAGFRSTACALALALVLNAAILVVSAAAFSTRGWAVPDLQTAHQLLTPVMGSSLAAALFAIALLCSGQSSSITGTLAGQVVMEGFLNLRLPPVWRRLLTRALAIVPAVGVLALLGEAGTMPLLLASQVVLSMQLPFAIVPLLRFTASPKIVGRGANSGVVRWGATLAALAVMAANATLLWELLRELRERSWTLTVLATVVLCGALGLLGWISFVPLRSARSRAMRGPLLSDRLADSDHMPGLRRSGS